MDRPDPSALAEQRAGEPAAHDSPYVEIDRLIEDEKYRRAERAIRKALDAEPAAPQLLLRLGQVQSLREAGDAVIETGRQLLAVDGVEAATLVEFAGHIDHDEQAHENFLDQAAARHPDDAALFVALRAAQAERRPLADLLTEYGARIRAAPEQAVLRLGRAELIVDHAGSPDDDPLRESAVADLDAVIDDAGLSVRGAGALLTRARLRHALGDDGFKADFERLREIAQDDAAPIEARMTAAAAGIFQMTLDPAALGDLFDRLPDSIEEPAAGESLSLDEHNARQLLQATSARIRSGQSPCEAISQIDENDPVSTAALSIAQSLINMANEPDPELEQTDAGQFPAYMQKHAAASTRALDGLGWSTLGDFEILNYRKLLGQSVMLRIFNCPENTHTAACYALRPQWPGLIAAIILWFKGQYRTARIVEFETYFDDGAVIGTNNQGGMNFYEQPPGVDYLQLPQLTTAAELHREHRQRVAAYQARRPSARLRPIATVEDHHAAGRELVARKREHRRNIGYVTENELRAQCGEQYDLFAHKIRAYVNELAAV